MDHNHERTLIETVREAAKGGTCTEIARRLGIADRTLRERLQRAHAAGITEATPLPAEPTAPTPAPERRVEQTKILQLSREHRSMADEVLMLRRQIDSMGRLTAAPLPPVKRRELKSGIREATAIAALSDLHCEERVRRSDTPTGNAYNLEISRLRLERFFAGVEWLIEYSRGGAAFKIRDLVLWLGGDLMSGHIHEENVETSALPPIATMLWLQPQIIAGIDRLLERGGLETIRIVCSYGNHGRDTRRTRFATGAHHSYEWGMYQTIAAHYKDNPRVSVSAPPASHQYTEVYDFTLCTHHGDAVKYGGGVGGITIPINKAVAQWDLVRRADYYLFGHWHQYIDTGKVAVNGSVIGFNGYAMGIKATPEPPQQAFFLIDSRRGKTVRAPIWVSDRDAEAGLA